MGTVSRDVTAPAEVSRINKFVNNVDELRLFSQEVSRLVDDVVSDIVGQAPDVPETGHSGKIEAVDDCVMAKLESDIRVIFARLSSIHSDISRLRNE